MDQSQIEEALSDLPLGKIGYFGTIGSTNDLAAKWATDNLPEYSLIIADEQTRGRGRSGRKWYTPAGSALAISIILKPRPGEGVQTMPKFSGLGGLAVLQALASTYNLNAKIIWPNDVLIVNK
ncbi:MAG: hypothetical protein N2D54_03135 [Chloroflexota bacterium]